MTKGIGAYRELYRGGGNPETVLREKWEQAGADPDQGIWIHREPWEGILEQIAAAEARGADELPLFGVPFAIKDNIDWAGRPTTAGCPAYSYVPEESAPVVDLLLAAGAICLGKTNLDQFATGLVGVRSPYAPPKNPFDAHYLPGGSSCGSAVAVARGQVAFALGTDTAGSGRVPAAFNELVGLKPSRGLISTRGVVPACRSLDCVSIFASSCPEAAEVLAVAGRYDPEEPWSRPGPASWPRFPRPFRFGVPPIEELEFFGWDEAATLFAEAAARLRSIGGEAVEVSLAPFLEAARLLYEGPWVTERYVAIEEFLCEQPEALWPVTREIIAGGAAPTAADAFKAQYRLAECRRTAGKTLAEVDVLLAPTAPRNFTLDEVEAEPVLRNSQLGTYTNFMNLLDLAAVALPAGRYQGRLPWGVTLFAPAHTDRALLELGSRYEAEGTGNPPAPIAGPWDEVPLVVCGAHMADLPLNHQLTDRGGRLLESSRTAPCYRMFVIPGDGALPERPGMLRSEDGTALAVEVWLLSREAFGDFVARIPAPLGIGTVELADGRKLPGFLAEPWAQAGAVDITSLGGWRAYIAQRSG